MNVRHLVLTLLFAIAAFAAIGASLWGSKSPSPVGGGRESESTRVRKGRFTHSLFVTGELAATRAVRISVPRFRERGQVPIQAMALEGSIVKAGDALLQIDNAQLIASLNSEEINLDKGENDLVRKQSELDIQLKDLEMELATRKLDLEKAQLKAEIEKDLIPLRDWQDNQFSFQAARKEFDRVTQKMALIRKAAAEEVTLLQIKRDQSRSRIKTIRDDLAALQIRAPVAGTVVYENAPTTWNRNENDPVRKFQVGDQVSPGQIVMSVVDLSEMEVRAFVSEVDGGLLQVGQRARVVVDSYPQAEFAAVVEYVPEVAERLRRLSNVRVFITRLKLDGADTQLMKPGMSVRAEIILGEPEGLMLPRKAVFEKDGRFYVHHTTGGKTEVKVVSRNAVALLIDGLLENDEIIVR
jgi:biotin carboxyl carrier protein